MKDFSVIRRILLILNPFIWIYIYVLLTVSNKIYDKQDDIDFDSVLAGLFRIQHASYSVCVSFCKIII